MSLKTVIAGLAFVAYSVHGFEVTADDMGPAAFLWPEDRVWSAAMDNTAPCGSVSGVTNRTDFPLKNGNVALVGQDESYNIELSISYLDNPKSNTDFSTLIDTDAFKAVDPGHTCVPIDDAPSSVKAGTNATLQIKYIANFDKPENETFYACADIHYVELSDFKESFPCFNYTQPAKDKDDKSSTTSSLPSATTSSSSDNDDKKGSSGGLSRGAIAGIVVGCVAGVSLVALAALLLLRRKSQRRSSLRQQQSSRGVDWARPAKDTASAGSDSVRMDNMNN